MHLTLVLKELHKIITTPQNSQELFSCCICSANLQCSEKFTESLSPTYKQETTATEDNITLPIRERERAQESERKRGRMSYTDGKVIAKDKAENKLRAKF